MAETEGRANVDRTVPAGRARRTGRGGAATSPEGRDASFGDLRQALADGRWVLLTVLAAALCAAAGYVFITAPTYRATALVQLQPHPEGGKRFEDISALFDPGPT